jgi:hypothetical protein
MVLFLLGAKQLFQRTLDLLNRDSGMRQSGTWTIPKPALRRATPDSSATPRKLPRSGSRAQAAIPTA